MKDLSDKTVSKIDVRFKVGIRRIFKVRVVLINGGVVVLGAL
jgi:hypothetical protein